MTDKAYIGIDNGVTGAIGIIFKGKSYLTKMPVRSEQNYTKAKGNITRVDHVSLLKILKPYATVPVAVVMERPMVDPKRFQASASALRCLEAVLVCLETLGLPKIYCDSKEWQKELLPYSISRNKKKKEGNKKTAQSKLRRRVKKPTKKEREEARGVLKKQSLDIARRLFPKLDYSSFKDGDAILIAEWARRKNY
jgi:hypothetical protein